MVKKIFDWIIDKWLASLLTGTIFFFANLYTRLPESEKENFFNFSWVRSILNSEVPFWQVLIISLFFIIVIIFKKKKISKKDYEVSSKNAETILSSFRKDNPEYKDYTNDYFGTSYSKWSWNNDFDIISGELTISNLRPNCIVCGSEMSLEGDMENTATCTRCKLNGKTHQYYLNEEKDDVRDEIHRRIKDGSWKNVKDRYENSKLF